MVQKLGRKKPQGWESVAKYAKLKVQDKQIYHIFNKTKRGIVVTPWQ